MKRSYIVLTFLCGLMVVPLIGQEHATETKATTAEVSEPLDKAALLAKRNALIAEATRQNGMIRAIRDRAMKQDKELIALTEQIAEIQATIEEKLHAQYPELKKLEASRQEAMDAYAEVHAALRELKQVEQAEQKDSPASAE
jgi:hypothetical protein